MIHVTRVPLHLTALAVLSTVLASAGPVLAADPTTADCLAASEGALASRNQHKLLDARAKLLVCSAASCPADIRAECAHRVEAVNIAMPTIVFEAKDTMGSDIGAVKVAMDGIPLVERLEGTALSIDPGEHRFAFETAGQAAVEKTFVIREGDKGRRERVVLGAGTTAEVRPAGATAPPPGLAATVVSSPNATSGPGPDREPPEGFWSSRRMAAVGVAGIGVAGVAVGSVFGLMSLSKHDEAKKACPTACTDQHGVDLWNSAHSAGNVSTVAFIVGVAGIAGGAMLWLTAPAPKNSGTQFGFGLGTAQLRGTW